MEPLSSASDIDLHYLPKYIKRTLGLYGLTYESTNALVNSLPTGVACSLDPDQARRFVGPDLGPNCRRHSDCITEINFQKR